jgi:hypothetical protein
VLMNPPFAPTGTQATRAEVVENYQTLAAAPNPASVNLAWPFVEIATRAAGTAGRAGLVLPLSVAYRTDPATTTLRTVMLGAASWRLRFFDRAPDAVFGDDIKQRICLATFSKSSRGLLATSRLIRWSSSRRSAVFRPGAATFHTRTQVGSTPFPKIGSDLEEQVLGQLDSVGESLGTSVACAKLTHPSELSAAGSHAVVVAPTAYNWIGAYRDPALARDGRKAAAGKANVLVFDAECRADAAYGLIASRVFLWWWRATSDLFHVPLRALRTAPFPLRLADPDALEDLAEAGRAVWDRARKNPIRSINRGVALTAYAPPAGSRELDAVDWAVSRAFRLPPGFVRFVQQDAERLLDAGRAA